MSKPKITIYTTHTCPFCKMEKAFLNEKKIAYEEIFVDDNEEKKGEMINLSGQMGTPVTLLDYGDEKTHFVGFNQAELNKVAAGELAGAKLIQEI